MVTMSAVLSVTRQIPYWESGERRVIKPTLSVAADGAWGTQFWFELHRCSEYTLKGWATRQGSPGGRASGATTMLRCLGFAWNSVFGLALMRLPLEELCRRKKPFHTYGTPHATHFSTGSEFLVGCIQLNLSPWGTSLSSLEQSKCLSP